MSAKPIPTRGPMRRARPDTRTEDRSIVGRLVEHDEAAWRDFVTRFDPVLKGHLARFLTSALETVMASDEVDDLIGDFHLAILENDMKALRDWARWSKGSTVQLKSWLIMIARRMARDRREHAWLVDEKMKEELDKASTRASNRADRWGAFEHALTVPVFSVSDPRRRVAYVWYGDTRVVIYDLDHGGEVGSFPVGVGWATELTEGKVRVAIKRLMRSPHRSKVQRAAKPRTH